MSPEVVPPPKPANIVPARRIAAYALDMVLFLLVSGLLYFAVSDRLSGAADPGCAEYQRQVGGAVQCVDLRGTLYALHGGAAIAFVLGIAALWLAYFGVLQGVTGATLGKRVFGIRTVDAEWRRCGPGPAVVRMLPLLTGFIPGIGPLLGLAMYVLETAFILSSASGQRLGDRWARTFVVRAGAVRTSNPPER